ncbi:hypothetical protein IFM89_020865 [Coptis chinensis]|uniref:ENTH domain-containing protein n=1 Tax=Coptis chinensis TaxID=261450 RepID=A0A835IX06_9MAGN|nr:hypothetical protein IFM89_020865 [Coptis chinensis]
MATLQTWRKAYGAIKDTTTVSLAKVNSDSKDVDVAIVKATNHVECPPKDRHLRKIFASTSAMRPRADVVYCIHALSRRLTKTHNWTEIVIDLTVALDILGDDCYVRSFFTSWDCSAWVRTYALFLEERLECFRTLKYDTEAERLPKPAQGLEKGYSKTRELDSEELLDQLPALQQLLYRLIGCRPEGAAVRNYLIQYALALVLKESFKVYCAINDGIINLVDKFFEMPRHEAVKALEVYRRAGQQAAGLSDFYEVCRGLELARNFQFPDLREPPQSFLTTMEEYIREAPRMVSVPREPLELPERLLLTYKPEEVPSTSDENKPSNLASQDQPDAGDLLGLHSTAYTDATVIEEANALALAIIPSNDSHNSSLDQRKELDPTGWELALVTTPSSNISSTNERQLAGGLDSLTLSSLYDEGSYRAAQQPVYGRPAPNPFEMQDPFVMSKPPPSFDIGAMPQQQQNPYGQFQPGYQQQQPISMGPSNPFGDAGFGPFSVNGAPQPHGTTNPFGGAGLL